MNYRRLALVLIMLTILGVSLGAARQTRAQAMPVSASALHVTAMDGVPSLDASANWYAAYGFASMTMGTDGTDAVHVVLENLVPNGLYTLWWVNTDPSMSVGPAGGTPGNEFTADANGNAASTITVPSDNDYQFLLVAYHADGQTHGDNPGRSGSETFSHLIGAFPGPKGVVQTGTTALAATNTDGVPAGSDAQAWESASAYVSMSRGLKGNDTVVVHAKNLVPNGVYTLWWVNNMGNMLTMQMGTAGGLPANQFTADAQGSATTAIEVPSNNDYQTLIVAYHADGQTHGDNPGKMGAETYSQLIGSFPGSGGMTMSRAVQLDATGMDGTPVDGWMNAQAVGEVTMGTNGNDTVVLYASNLVPNGLYTLWWVNNMGNMLSMQMGPAGGLPANQFNTDAQGGAVTAITVPSNNDYQTLIVAYHADGQTHGDNPGKMKTDTFSHLMGAFPGPAGVAGGM